MFSLIITIIAIALVAALAVACIYYGGTSLTKGGTGASADAVISQASQIAAAGHVATAQGGGWPTGAPSFSQPYLKSMPVPPKSAYHSATPAVADWQYYLPGGASYHFVLKDKINREVCLAVNKLLGFIGIPAAWDGKSIMQCFGAGTAVPNAYTFFYDPPGHTAIQESAAFEQSKAEAGLPPSATAGYPRLCPDGTTKATAAEGVCADTSTPASSDGGGPPPEDAGPPGPVYNSFFDSFDFIDIGDIEYDSAEIAVCSNTVPAGVLTPASVVKIDGTQATISQMYEFEGASCISVKGFPQRAAGAYPVTVKNTDGSTLSGVTVRYLNPAPTLTAISPEFGRANVEKILILSGDGFTNESVVKVRNYQNGSLGDSLVYTLYPEFVDSTTLRLTLPVSTAVGVPTPGPGGYGNISITVENPNSTPWNANRIYQYLDPNGPLD